MTRPIYLGRIRVDVTTREGIGAPVPARALARAMAAAARAAGAPEPASIGLILTDDDELTGLNVAHLGKQGATDVLSFPLLPSDAFPPHVGGSPSATTSGAVFALPPGRRPHLGDVVVSVERAIEQAEQGRGGHTGDMRWSPASELRLLVTHGTLHLCGWDHAEPLEEAAMRTLEARLLAP